MILSDEVKRIMTGLKLKEVELKRQKLKKVLPALTDCYHYNIDEMSDSDVLLVWDECVKIKNSTEAL